MTYLLWPIGIKGHYGYLLYSGKFSNGTNFHMKPGNTKIKLQYFNMQYFRTSNFEWVIPTRGSGDKAMALYQYFQPSDDLPDSSGPLSASVSPAAIIDANEAVRSATQSKPRCQSSHPSSRQRLASMPHCTATSQLFIIFQRHWESRWRLLQFRLGKEST